MMYLIELMNARHMSRTDLSDPERRARIHAARHSDRQGTA